MIEKRRPKLRRKGEQDGPFDWPGMLNTFCYIVIIVACFYVAFMAGRHYETVAQQDAVSHASVWKEYKSARVRGH